MTIQYEDIVLSGNRRLVPDPKYGFLRVTPTLTDEELEAYYAKKYQNPCVPHDPDGRADLVCSIAKRPGRVLDIGCGCGELLSAFAARGWDPVGIEPNSRAAEIARSKGIQATEEVFAADTARRLGSFDAILFAHVLEHLPRPDEIIQLARSILAPHGLLFCEVPNDFNPLQEVACTTMGLKRYWVSIPDHLNYFSIETLASFIAALAFDIRLKTTDFPVELFLLMGDNYVGDPDKGQEIHQKRCAFEKKMYSSGKKDLLRNLYESMAGLGIGREAIVCASKRT